MIVTDRSRTESYLYCGMERALRYSYNPATGLYDGYGIVPEGDSPDAAFGLVMHDALQKGLYGATLEELLLCLDPLEDAIQGTTPDGEPSWKEYYYLGYGQLTAFATRFRHKLLSQYKIVSTEHSITFPIRGADGFEVTWMARIDGAMRKYSDNSLLVLEWKTSSYTDSLAYEYEYSLQTTMEIYALQHALQEYVSGMLLVGIDKGQHKRVTDKEYESGLRGKRFLSPFTYIYKSDSGFKVDYSIKWKPNSKATTWDRIPVWRDFTAAEYMAYLETNEPEVFDDVFSAPFPLNVSPQQVQTAMVDILEIERRIASGERPIHSWPNCHRNHGFPNKECAYIQVCHHNEWDGYVDRQPHHQLEASLKDTEEGVSSNG